MQSTIVLQINLDYPHGSRNFKESRQKGVLQVESGKKSVGSARFSGPLVKIRSGLETKLALKMVKILKGSYKIVIAQGSRASCPGLEPEANLRDVFKGQRRASIISCRKAGSFRGRRWMVLNWGCGPPYLDGDGNDCDNLPPKYRYLFSPSTWFSET